MRSFLPAAVLLVALLAAQTADAQLRADVPTRPAPVAVYEQPSTGFSLGQLFNTDHFRIGHSYEFSYNSFGGEGLGLGVYTTSLSFQPSHRLAARVQLGVAHSPFGSSALQQQLGFDQDQPARVFLREATLAYRPTENSVITFSVQQSPYGGYHQPFGHGFSPYGGSAIRAQFAPVNHDALFWRSNDR